MGEMQNIVMTKTAEDRKQGARINGQFPPWEKDNSRVPSDSVLGMVVFNIFINELKKARGEKGVR